MLYEEFSSYFAGRQSYPELKCIGWLDAVADYAVGDPPDPLDDRLVEILRTYRVRPKRGHQPCPICKHAGLVDPRAGVGPENRLGGAEIWVSDPNGGWFCAPDRILHYIRAHRYCPPEAFVRAALDGPILDARTEARAYLERSVAEAVAAAERGEPMPPDGPPRG